MKKVLLLSLILILIGGTAFALTLQCETELGGVGGIRDWFLERDKNMIYSNASSSAYLISDQYVKATTSDNVIFEVQGGAKIDNLFASTSLHTTIIPGTAGGILDMNGYNILLNDGWLTNDGDDEGLRIDNNGNVGIGTSTPITELEIVGTATFDKINLGGGLTEFILNGVALDAVVGATSQIATELQYIGIQHSNVAAAGSRFMLARSRGTLAAPLVVQDGNALGALDFAGYDGTDYVLAAQIDAEVDGTVAGNRVDGSLLFKTSNNSVLPTERMRITSAGNVGIGTTTPDSVLHIVGTNAQAGGITIESSGGASADRLAIYPSGDSSTVVKKLQAAGYLHFQNSAGGAQMTIDNSGKVGIGTNAPGDDLEVITTSGGIRITDLLSAGDAATPFLSLYDSTEQLAYLGFPSNTNSNLTIFNDVTGGEIYLTTTAGDVIIPNGNVGIGTTSPVTRRLHVYGVGAAGDIKAERSDGTGYLVLGNGTQSLGYNTGAGRFVFTDDLNIDATSNTQIIMTDDNSYSMTMGIASANGSFSNIAVASDGVIRTDSNNLILSARNATGDIKLSTGVTDSLKMIIKNSGNVGIGTTTPDQALTIGDAGATTAIHIDGGDNSYLYIDRSLAARRAELEFQTSGVRDWIVGVSDSDNMGDGTEFFISNGSSGGAGADLVINSDGNVGIGTTTPGALLDVGNPASGDGIHVGRVIGSASIAPTGDAPGGWLIMDSAGSGDIGLNYYDDGDVEMVIGGGRVGIGGGSPEKLLTIVGADPIIALKDTTDGEGWAIWDGTDYFGIYEYTSALSSGSNRLVVKEGGNVGIGTTSPNALLALEGSAKEMLKVHQTTIAGTENRAIDIIPQDALQANEHWTGVRIDASNLDPAGSSTRIRGFAANFSGIDMTNNPEGNGLRILTPSQYPSNYQEDFGAIHLEGNGQTIHMIDSDNHALHIEGGTSVFDYASSTLEDGETIDIISMVVDINDSTGGDLHFIDAAVANGAGSADIAALGVGPNIDPIHQEIGDPANLDYALIYDDSLGTWTTSTVAFNAAGTDLTIFDGDDDYIYIGSLNMYDRIPIALDTAASISILPDFEYSTATGTWSVFTPADDTNGFTQNGDIRFSSSDLVGWAHAGVNGTAGGYYWIRIKRNRTILGTSPIEDTIQVLAIDATYYWNESGDVYFRNGTTTGSWYVNGKLTVIGGTDPAYVMYDPRTRQETIDLVNSEVPLDKRNGLVVFYNKDIDDLEIYLPDRGEFRPYGVSNELLERIEELEERQSIIIRFINWIKKIYD